MADVATTSQSSRRRTRRVKVKIIHSCRPPPEPTLAFGFVLDYQCRLRWAKYFLEADEGGDPPTYTPEEYEDMLKGLLAALDTAIPNRVYCALPDLPRVRWCLLPIEDGELAYNRWVFALRDNSSSRNLHSPLTPEHIEAVRKELGLEDDQQPKWVPIPILLLPSRLLGTHTPSPAIPPHDIDLPPSHLPHTAFYVLSVMHAGGVLGRIVPPFLSDSLGRYNILVPCAFLTELAVPVV
ncbi:hypothetical protein LXA43DRAFT_1095851 [Ganoderma leucocontextum]|nr:hypothetical protein LXA43DRAFT_1095851 [Ganoderma leucocontextum]